MLERRLKGGDKKYFDSADWAQSQDKSAQSEAPVVSTQNVPWPAAHRPSEPPTQPPRPKLGPR